MADIPNLTDDEWKDLTVRLTGYAQNKMARLYWRGLGPNRGGTPAGGIGPDDIAAEAIFRVLDGRREWHGQGEVFPFFCDVVDSLVSHLVDSAENQRSRRMPTTDEENEPYSATKSRVTDPFQIIADDDEASTFRKLVRTAVEKDDFAGHLFDCIDAGFIAPGDMAEVLGVQVEEIYAGKKRLQRAVASALNTYRRKGSNHARRS